jgi:REP element-mobilizing transposase RayT
MSRDDARPIRRMLRLKHYDYTQAGAYFVTVCTQNRNCLFGVIRDGVMCLNDAGRMIESAWEELENRFSDMSLDAFVVMPNHLHGIIVLAAPEASHMQAGHAPGCAPPVGAGLVPAHTPPLVGAGLVPARSTLATVMGAFKSISTVKYTRGVAEFGWPGFRGRVWQRSYFEHVIRDEAALSGIREYIANNPLQWALDRENPANAAKPRLGASPVLTSDESAQSRATTRVAPTPWEGV